MKNDFPGEHLVLYKSDVQGAFLNLPAHPIWQLRQIITVDALLYIVWMLVFGSRTSPWIGCAISGLTCRPETISYPFMFTWMTTLGATLTTR